MAAAGGAFRVTVRTKGLVELRFVMPLPLTPPTVRQMRDRAMERVKRLTNEAFTLGDGGHVRDDDGCVLFLNDPVSYTHLPSPRDRQKSRMPSSA